ncbi:MAG TPA: ABC transporter substrate-binding protein [Candidatus Acidoferrales bacterium]|nr:ABC transporter substrate-binding protein [Candidatus Acidoferrales bacterium]
MIRRCTLWATLIAVLAASAGSARGDEPAPMSIKVAMSVVNYDAAPLFYAQRSGMFARAGLQVQIERIASGAATAAAVASRTIDIGKSTSMSVLSGFARNIPFTIIAPAAVYDASSPDGQLVVAPDSPIRTAADLDGKLLGTTTLLGIDHVATLAWVDGHGGNSQTLRYVELPISAVPNAVAQHRIDAAFGTEPVLSDAIAAGKVRPIIPVLSAIGKRFLFSVWFTSVDFTRANPEAVKRFVAVITQAQLYVNAHHKEMAPLVADLSGLPVSEVQNAKLATCGTSLTAADLQPIINVAAKYRAIPQAYDAKRIIYREMRAR